VFFDNVAHKLIQSTAAEGRQQQQQQSTLDALEEFLNNVTALKLGRNDT
jgi:hypothetical protein